MRRARVTRAILAATLIGVGAALAARFTAIWITEEALSAPAWVARLIDQAFIQAQFGIFCAGLAYGLITLVGLGTDRSTPERLPASAAERMLQIRLAPSVYCAWLLPVLGFIGTVVGISHAIGPLEEMVAQAGGAAQMGAVLAGLRFAFDTTLVGLAGAVPLTALVHVLETRMIAAQLAIGESGPAE